MTDLVFVFDAREEGGGKALKTPASIGGHSLSYSARCFEL